MSAAVTSDPSKSEVEIAAVQIIVDDVHHKRAPEAVAPHVSIFPGAFQLFEVRFDTSIIWTEMRAAGFINILFQSGASA